MKRKRKRRFSRWSYNRGYERGRRDGWAAGKRFGRSRGWGEAVRAMRAKKKRKYPPGYWRGHDRPKRLHGRRRRRYL